MRWVSKIIADGLAAFTPGLSRVITAVLRRETV